MSETELDNPITTRQVEREHYIKSLVRIRAPGKKTFKTYPHIPRAPDFHSNRLSVPKLFIYYCKINTDRGMKGKPTLPLFCHLSLLFFELKDTSSLK